MKKKIPSIAKGSPKTSPKRRMNSGHSRPNSNESTVPGDRADHEGDRRDLRPALGQLKRHVVAAPQPDVVGDQDDRREAHAEARQDDVEAERERHLAARGAEVGREREEVGHRTACGLDGSRPGAVELALDQGALALAEARPDPLHQHPHAPADLAAEVVEVNPEVGEEGRPARELQPPDLADRLAAADDRERSLVEVLERGRGPALATADRLGDVMGLLDRHRREAGERLAVWPGQGRAVADHGDLGLAGQRQSGLTSMRPPRSVLRPGGLGERVGQRHRLHAGRPDDGPGVDPLGGSLQLDRDAVRVDRGGARALADRDPEPAELLARPSPRASR